MPGAEIDLQMLEKMSVPLVRCGHVLGQCPALVFRNVIHIPKLFTDKMGRKDVNAFLRQLRANGVDRPESGGQLFS